MESGSTVALGHTQLFIQKSSQSCAEPLKSNPHFCRESAYLKLLIVAKQSMYGCGVYFHVLNSLFLCACLLLFTRIDALLYHFNSLSLCWYGRLVCSPMVRMLVDYNLDMYHATTGYQATITEARGSFPQRRCPEFMEAILRRCEGKDTPSNAAQKSTSNCQPPAFLPAKASLPQTFSKHSPNQPCGRGKQNPPLTKAIRPSPSPSRTLRPRHRRRSAGLGTRSSGCSRRGRGSTAFAPYGASRFPGAHAGEGIAAEGGRAAVGGDGRLV